MFHYLLDYERKTRNFTSFFEMDTNKKAVKRTNFERLTAIFWSRIRDSNPPPTAWEAVALPDELTLQDCSISVAKCGGFVNSFFCRNAAGGKTCFLRQLLYNER